MICLIGAEGLDRRGPVGSCGLFLGPGFRLAARWNRLVETVKTRKKREKTGGKWARYGLKRVKESGSPGPRSADAEEVGHVIAECVGAARRHRPQHRPPAEPPDRVVVEDESPQHGVLCCRIRNDHRGPIVQLVARI